MPKAQKKPAAIEPAVIAVAKPKKILVIKVPSPDKMASRVSKNDPAIVNKTLKLPAPSKQATLITLLQRVEGATIDELVSHTGWQRHSIHGTMSGVLKKRLGYVIDAVVEPRGRVYRIVGSR